MKQNFPLWFANKSQMHKMYGKRPIQNILETACVPELPDDLRTIWGGSKIWTI